MFIETQTVTATPINAQPLYFGGFGLENWRGFLTDVRLYNRALSAAEALALSSSKGGSPTTIEFTDISIDADRNIVLTWTSEEGRSYGLDVSTDLTPDGTVGGWIEINDSISSGGTTTSETLPGNQFPFANMEDQLFFRARETD